MIIIGKYINCIGKKFNRLTVISELKKNNRYYLKCMCDCGNIIEAEKQHVLHGKIKSCGCLNMENRHKRLKDLTGQRFGRLVVQKRSDNDFINYKGRHIAKWDCLCDCGNIVSVVGNSLKQGYTTSCGCYQKEKSKENGKKCKIYNRYDLSGEYGIGWTSNTNKEFYFDLEDYDRIKDYCWSENNSGKGYIYTSFEGKCILLHNLILTKNEIDHINHNPKDNRKNNLRIVTRSQNQMNVGIKKNNKSGVTGVWWDKRHNSWVAKIQKNKIRYTLGYFEDFDKAVKVRKEAEQKYFGEYSYDNSINRDALKADIVAHGGTVVGSVSSKTSYLINNDINSTSSKNQKAKSLNIPIISEEEFLKMINRKEV